MKKKIDEPFTNYEILKFQYYFQKVHPKYDRIPYVNTNNSIASINIPENPYLMFYISSKYIIKTAEYNTIDPIKTTYINDVSEDAINAYRLPYYDIIPEPYNLRVIDNDGEQYTFFSVLEKNGYICDDITPIIDVDMCVFKNYHESIYKSHIISQMRCKSYMPISLLKTYTNLAVRGGIRNLSLPYITHNSVFRNIDVNPKYGVNPIMIAVPSDYYLVDNIDNCVDSVKKELMDAPSIPDYYNLYILPYWIFMKIIGYNLSYCAVNKKTLEKKLVSKIMYPEAFMMFKSRLGNIDRCLHIRLDI